MNSTQIFSWFGVDFGKFLPNCLTQNWITQKLLIQLTSNFQGRCIYTRRTFIYNLVTKTKHEKSYCIKCNNLLNQSFTLPATHGNNSQMGGEQESCWSILKSVTLKLLKDIPKLFRKNASILEEHPCKFLLQKNWFEKSLSAVWTTS